MGQPECFPIYKHIFQVVWKNNFQNLLFSFCVHKTDASAAEFPARETNRGTLPPTQFSSRAPDIGREPVVGIGNREVRRSDEPKQQVHVRYNTEKVEGVKFMTGSNKPFQQQHLC